MLAEAGCSDKRKSDQAWPQIKISSRNVSYVFRGSSQQPLKILHIGDIHMDQAYVVGSESNCESPACCRYLDPFEVRANKWGDYGRCDQPAFVFQNSLEQMRKQHGDIDLIYLTGNVLHHHMWDLSKEEVIRDIGKAAAVVRASRAFQNVPAIVALGNHDTHAFGLFAPRGATADSCDYLYNGLETTVKQRFYRNPSVKFPEYHEGYYSASPFKGLRVIVLNNNIANIHNWWLLHPSGTDLPIRQLQFMYDTLEAAERANERVHIVAHLPPGSALLVRDWSVQYRRIVQRFADVIAAQFAGNTHLDEFRIMYGDDGHPLNVAWIAGSLAAYSGVNPSYRVYQLDSGDFSIHDHDTYYFDLEEANRNHSRDPMWKLEYRMRSAYQLSDLSPASLHKLMERFAANKTLRHMYQSYQTRRDSPSDCDDDCSKELLCRIVRNYPKDTSTCEKLKIN